MQTVDVIIPTYKPNEKLKKIITLLEQQTHPVQKIILINTEQKYFDHFFYSTGFLEQYKNIVVRHISKYEFDHGATRRMGVELSTADYFVCMTDDAVPLNETLIENLLKHHAEPMVAVSYARQCVPKKCGEIERFSRKFNYPLESRVKSLKDLPELGIKTYFCSDVCAMYNRQVYNLLDGFVKRAIFNEDMLFAAKAMDAGYQVAYAADAKVRHYHKYNNLTQLRRNFDNGVSQAMHPDVFAKVPATKEGKRLVKATVEHLKKVGKKKQIPGFYVTCAYKYIGFFLGKHYKKLPKWLIAKCTSNPIFFKKGVGSEVHINPAYGYGRSQKEDEWAEKEKLKCK
ncbi:MAG: glycosyltransferase [Lachnospiraceae bacterium]|nr:glycosyltransferase [Lachnospiraceae bacterium]